MSHVYIRLLLASFEKLVLFSTAFYVIL